MDKSSWRIRIGGLDTPGVQRLLARHVALSAAESEGSDHALSAPELSHRDVLFWSAWEGDGLILGFIALKSLPSQPGGSAGEVPGEVKSMHVAEEARGRGVGQALLGELIGEARALGFTRLFLETGHRPHFASAVRLYRRTGFLPCAPFPPYQDDPCSLFMTLNLDSDSRTARQARAGAPWLADDPYPR